MTLDEIEALITEGLKRSDSPQSDLYLKHRLNYEDRDVSKEDVTLAINRLLKRGQIRVSSFVVTDFDRQQMLELTGAPVQVSKPKAPKSSDELRKKLSEAHTGRKLSDEHRRRISEGHRNRHLKKREEAAVG